MTGKFKVPHTLVLLYGMVLLAYVLTLVLPAGQFQTEESHGHEVVVPAPTRWWEAQSRCR